MDPTSSIPLYLQLKEVILENINTGTFIPLKKIPSENDLSTKYNISRITVRKAIESLVEEGYLTKRQGKGTFVSEISVNKNYEGIVGYGNIMINQGKKPKRKVLTLEYLNNGNYEIKEALGLSSNSDIIHLQRLLFSDSDVLMLEDSYYSFTYSFLFNYNLEKESTYDLIKKHLGLIPYRAERTISIFYSNSISSDVFKVKDNYPLLSSFEYVYDKQGIPIHASKQIMNPKTKLHISAISSQKTILGENK